MMLRSVPRGGTRATLLVFCPPRWGERAAVCPPAAGAAAGAGATAGFGIASLAAGRVCSTAMCAVVSGRRETGDVMVPICHTAR